MLTCITEQLLQVIDFLFISSGGKLEKTLRKYGKPDNYLIIIPSCFIPTSTALKSNWYSFGSL